MKLNRRDFIKANAAAAAMSVAGLPATLVVQALVPRMLGPSAYGNFGFLSAFFLQVIAFCDIGLSSAFYNKLSQRQHMKVLTEYESGTTTPGELAQDYGVDRATIYRTIADLKALGAEGILVTRIERLMS